MKYERPEIRLSAEAIRTIETHSKWMGSPDLIIEDQVHTTAAYEADE
ncbi:MAG: hypothetical protein WB621_25045 [Candidatus Acidiferrales bacterium]